MKKSCLLALVFLIILTVAYTLFLKRYIVYNGVWFLGFFGALSVLLLVGALRTLFFTLKKVGAIRNALNVRPFEDRKMIAAVGTIRPDGDPLESPIQKEKCVAYETELFKRSFQPTSSGSSQGRNDYVYVGVAMTPCRISTLQGEVRLLGFPLLNEFPQKNLKDVPFQENLLAYLKTVSLQPMDGFKKLQLFSKMENVMTDEDGALRQDWKLGRIPELEKAAETRGDSIQARPSDDDLEDEEEDSSWKEEPEGPLEGYQLGERTVAVGESVVALGTYSATQGGIEGRFKLGGMPNELYPGTPQAVSKKIRGSAVSVLIFSIIFFSFFHGLLAFIILNAPKQ